MDIERPFCKMKMVYDVQNSENMQNVDEISAVWIF